MGTSYGMAGLVQAVETVRVLHLRRQHRGAVLQRMAQQMQVLAKPTQRLRMPTFNAIPVTANRGRGEMYSEAIIEARVTITSSGKSTAAARAMKPGRAKNGATMTEGGAACHPHRIRRSRVHQNRCRRARHRQPSRLMD
ncbi:MAG: hypothetical protein ACOH1V_06800 [Stenotrophomonas sp.]